ncbi:hypothetical protein SAMN04487969_116123 [Paenibacillus algorifonticola]|uniref:Uncharacterized protein n=1 Tax=Paenibacillus algorifonticola TaxID=684063 RepID=A0A1I2GIC3_9BACL|nr:hypothetical protein [Paenibacillus algorifonticola]SFF17624.1 hypothetical protein SAMN04487969_116123 [Paenibacillus algorifonticola]
MGMDFTAYQAHYLDQAGIHQFFEDLTQTELHFPAIHTFIQEIIRQNPTDNREWRLFFDDSTATHVISGPGGFGLTLSEKVCLFDHFIRWGAFLVNHKAQLVLRNVCYELKAFFKSSYVIYVPDNAAMESVIMDFLWKDQNRDIGYMKDWLLKNCGMPKDKIRAIYKNQGQSWVSDGYYIDYFQDFKSL